MKSAWNDDEARSAVLHTLRTYAGTNEDVALRAYTSRLIGRESALVLHGGGNTSVKTTLPDDLGVPTRALCVKGSGFDLADIEPPGLPALRLEPLLAFRRLSELSDEAMVNAARTRLFDASAPNPSVEYLLHAFLPHAFIDHSHADAILSIVDQPDARGLAAEIYGSRLAIVPYVMPGFALAKLAAEAYEANPACEGLLLLQHGLFTFGASARESYERHVRAVDDAERAILRSRRSAARSVSPVPERSRRATDVLPRLRGALGREGRVYVLQVRQSPAISEFVARADLGDLATRGPVTPDHVLRTKPWPLVLGAEAGEGVAEADTPTSLETRSNIEGEVQGFRDRYGAYVAKQLAAKNIERRRLDPEPRVVLVPGLGLVTAGASRKDAAIAADIYEHTAQVILDAESIGRYQPLDEGDLFDLEYWSLEQAKLGKAVSRPLGGRIALITGAARGIGAATAKAFRRAGAEVFLVDRLNDRLSAFARELGAPYAAADLTDEDAVERCYEQLIHTFGGVDLVVSNAGTAPQSPMEACSSELLRDSLEVNLVSHHRVARRALEVFRAQGLGGCLLFNGSKSAFNPGPGFGPYAIAKAGLLALMRQYAVEGAAWGVTSNAINADRVRTELLDADEVESRARARGLSADAYYRSNLLGQEVTAEHVAESFLALALAPRTTGTVLTVDGGNIAAAPR